MASACAHSRHTQAQHARCHDPCCHQQTTVYCLVMRRALNLNQTDGAAFVATLQVRVFILPLLNVCDVRPVSAVAAQPASAGTQAALTCSPQPGSASRSLLKASRLDTKPRNSRYSRIKLSTYGSASMAAALCVSLMRGVYGRQLACYR
jgi:hypothetical protein